MDDWPIRKGFPRQNRTAPRQLRAGASRSGIDNLFFAVSCSGMKKASKRVRRTVVLYVLTWAIGVFPAMSVACSLLEAREIAVATPAAQRSGNFERRRGAGTGTRVAASDDAAVKSSLAEARTLLTRAKAALAAGDEAAAVMDVHQALGAFMAASRRLPSEDSADLESQAARYQNLRQGIDVFLQAHQRNARRLSAEGGKAVAGFDGQGVAHLVEEAEQKAKGGGYAEANALLAEAQEQVTGAIRQMMQHRTLVHEVTLDTPEDEYRYELQRYHGYVELIPVAIEMRVPPPATVTSMRASVDKAQWMLEQAEGKAGAGDYPVAIRMVLDATDEVRSALRQAGVEM